MSFILNEAVSSKKIGTTIKYVCLALKAWVLGLSQRVWEFHNKILIN